VELAKGAMAEAVDVSAIVVKVLEVMNDRMAS